MCFKFLRMKDYKKLFLLFIPAVIAGWLFWWEWDTSLELKLVILLGSFVLSFQWGIFKAFGIVDKKHLKYEERLDDLEYKINELTKK